MIYELFDGKHGSIRSVGSNGKDEKGNGDDIEMELVPISD